MPTNPYAPNETASDLWLEKSNLVGAVLGGVAYGVHVAVFAESTYAICRSIPLRKVGGRSLLPLAFIFVLFAMGTIDVACNTRMTQLMFIDNRAYPGGPNAWFSAFYSIGVNTAGNTSYVVANALADGVLLWRTYTIWNSFWVILFLSIVYLTSTAISILSVFQASRPTASLWTDTTVQFTVPYFSISIGLNILLTLLLVSRLLYMGYHARRTIGKDHSQTYISIATMLVESAAPYAITGLMFIIMYAHSSNVQNLILPVLGQIMCISPEVIILRVAVRRAISTRKPTKGELTMSMQFRAKPVEIQSSFDLTSRGTTNLSGSDTLGSAPGSRPDLLDKA
ncbi:hypothetical protein V8D89_014548 [Ganoderma adspersum]